MAWWSRSTGPSGAPASVSALAEVAEDFAMTATAITDIDTVVAHLRDHTVDGQHVLGEDDLARIAAYRERWGA